MLNVHPRPAAAPITPDALAGAAWVDLFDPTPEEVALVERAFGLPIPSREAVSEIEASKRLRVDGGVLCMSAPLIAGGQGERWITAPAGFLLSSRICITVRFARHRAFEAVAEALEKAGAVTPAEAFTRLLEEVVDRAADHLERVSDQMGEASRAIFPQEPAPRRSLSRDTERLRQAMLAVGRASEHMSRTRYTLVCIGRMAQFTGDRTHDWLEPRFHERLGGVKTDVASLEQFAEHLLSRIQLLQDAATAFISMEQNDVVKVLTIASVVGIPPVLVVGVYGMNFKGMPELTWAWGYPYALALLVLSAVVPLIWFKLKDWM